MDFPYHARLRRLAERLYADVLMPSRLAAYAELLGTALSSGYEVAGVGSFWHDEIQLSVMLGITATLLLYFKPELRGLSQQLTRRDLLSVLQFAVLSLIILPLLPNQNYGPYGAINPYQRMME